MPLRFIAEVILAQPDLLFVKLPVNFDDILKCELYINYTWNVNFTNTVSITFTVFLKGNVAIDVPNN